MEYLALTAWTVLTVLACRPRRIVVQPTIGQENLFSLLKKEEKPNKEDYRPSSRTDLLGLAILIPTGLFAMAGWAWIFQGVVR